MKQLSFAEAEYMSKKHITRREEFLERMESLIPWEGIEQLLSVYYYRQGGVGRQAYPLGSMLRVHCLQLFYNLSDPQLEDELYEIEPMRRFARLHIDSGIPDETTILNFRHFLEKHGLGAAILSQVNEVLSEKGLLLRQGTIADASIISAPSSTKNQSKSRDPEMHSTKKGNQYYFGMKVHIGVDDISGMVHSVVSTSAERADVTVLSELLHGDEERVFADAGYVGIEKRPETQHLNNQVAWYISQRYGKRSIMDQAQLKLEKLKVPLNNYKCRHCGFDPQSLPQ